MDSATQKTPRCKISDKSINFHFFSIFDLNWIQSLNAIFSNYTKYIILDVGANFKNEPIFKITVLIIYLTDFENLWCKKKYNRSF